MEKEKKRTHTQPPHDETASAAAETAAEQPAVEQIQQELETSKQKCSEYFEGWQRERADFTNYKKRIEREQAQLTQNISGSIIKRYLIILDDLERALKARPADGDGAVWAEGVELIYRKLQNILDQENIIRIPAETEEFDPNRHEALSYEESPNHQSNQIIEVIEQGYMQGDRILRPARVRVAR